MKEGVIPIETKHGQTLESSRDPAESERTLCRDGRASTGSESQYRLPPSGIPELYSGGCTEKVVDTKKGVDAGGEDRREQREE